MPFVTVHAERDHKSAKEIQIFLLDLALTDLFLRLLRIGRCVAEILLLLHTGVGNGNFCVSNTHREIFLYTHLARRAWAYSIVCTGCDVLAYLIVVRFERM